MADPHHAIQALAEQVEACLAPDRASFRRRLRGARRALLEARLDPAALATLERDVHRSVQRRAARVASVPPLTYPEELPVAQQRSAIAAAMAAHQVVVVAGDTGSGKTTQLPKIALGIGRGLEGAIALTQPRRIAARSVAAWLAQDLGSPLGQVVGFKVRFDDRTQPNSLVRVMTDGVLLAEIETDPRLLRYDTIIVDEAHERSLNVDFLIGYLKRLLPQRPDLKVVIASATLDVERFSAHFDHAPVVQVGGRLHPIELRTRPAPQDDPEQPPLERVPAAVEECLADGPGDILVFLGGERDIQDTADALRRMPSLAEADILPLFARLSTADQDRIFQPGPKRRVILATNIAETSVTVPRIRFVVDTGVARMARWSGKHRVLRLPVEPVSRASADQRKGRCGRVGPGLCIRLYSDADYLAREPFTAPELLRTNLASVILQMKALRLGPAEKFPFLEQPSPRLVAEGLETLAELAAVDRAGELTPLGRQMARLPVDPRLSRMILAAREEGCLAEAIVVAAALSTQDPRERPADQQGLADMAHALFRHPDSDFGSTLKLWRRWQAEAATKGSSALRRWARQQFLSPARMREWTELVEQLTRMVAERVGHPVPPLPEESDLPRLHRAVLAGFPSQLAHRTPEGDYMTASGGRFHIFPGSVLARRPSHWVVAADIVETGRRWGRMVARVQGDWLERIAPHLVQHTRSEPHWVAATGQVAAWERLSYGRLTLVPRRRVPYGPVAPAEARDIFIHAALVEGDCTLDAPFVRHNHTVLQEIQALEAKRREPGLLVESEALFRFFDARIPADVHSLPAFQRWRKQAEATDPRCLFMRHADLLQQLPDPDLALRFPDQAELGGVAVPLQYQHAPGGEADGVTARVTLDQLAGVAPERAEWLVPGLLVEKMEALLRTLPKRLRLRFFPLRETAQGAAETLPFGQGRLLDRLAEHLTRLGGTQISAADFQPEELPPHLRMHVQVVDAHGAVLAQGRDLAALRRQLAGAMRAHRAQQYHQAFGTAWERNGLTTFDLLELPERLQATVEGHTLVAYPALVDHGSSVALRLLPDAARAEVQTRAGLRRLFALAARQAIDHHLEYLPELAALEPHWQAATGSAAAGLHDQIALLAAGLAFVDGRPVPRTVAAFEARLDEGMAGLWEAVHAAVDHASAILPMAADLARALNAAPASWAPAVADIRARLRALVPPDALTRPDAPAPADLARYVRALTVRLRKLSGGGVDRDVQLQAAVRTWEDELARAEATLAAEGSDPAHLAPFRRLLQEYQISLFAQEVRTSVPVSAERLERAWREQARPEARS